jgi:hypothetical protein
MAIDPSAVYPGQVITGDPDYPRGKARNVTVAGDGTGTPWEAQLVNDILGFQQALLEHAQASPSGTPESIAESQYLDAIQGLATFAAGDVVAPIVAPIEARLEALNGPIQIVAPPVAMAASNFAVQPSGGSVVAVQSGNSSVGVLFVPISIPSGWRITTAGVVIKGSLFSSHSALPATMPTFALLRANADGSTTNVCATTSDDSATTTALDAWHTLSATTFGSFDDVLVNGNAHYHFSLTGDTGANSEGDVAFRSVFVLIVPSTPFVAA